jgi:four helix bundle protein
MFPFRDLKVWQRATKFAAGVLHLQLLVRTRQADLVTGQMWRAAASISANVAEGAAQDSHRQFARYLSIAYGSAAEVESHLLLALEAELVDAAAVSPLLAEVESLKRMIWRFRERVRQGPRPNP